MKKVLVTGANGYIGTHVVNELLKKRYNVYASDIRFDYVDQRATRVTTPIFSGDKDIYEKLGSPDVCIHLAWRNGFVHNSETHIQDLYSHYTFLNNMITGGLKQLSVMGTMHEIGYWEGAIDESTPTNPSSMYGIAKNTLRQLVTLITGENHVDMKWLRAYYITGDDLRSNSIFAKIAKMEQEGKERFPFTTGTNKYDFIDIEQLAEQIVAASIQTEVSGIINCCSGNPITLSDKVEEFIRKNNFKIKLEYGAFKDREYDSKEVWGDSSKIKLIMEKQK
jgi:dTDP-6-deoxy-L-talose 4-dehydrogenase (NAD+)